MGIVFRLDFCSKSHLKSFCADSKQWRGLDFVPRQCQHDEKVQFSVGNCRDFDVMHIKMN